MGGWVSLSFWSLFASNNKYKRENENENQSHTREAKTLLRVTLPIILVINNVIARERRLC